MYELILMLILNDEAKIVATKHMANDFFKCESVAKKVEKNIRDGNSKVSENRQWVVGCRISENYDWKKRPQSVPVANLGIAAWPYVSIFFGYEVPALDFSR